MTEWYKTGATNDMLMRQIEIGTKSLEYSLDIVEVSLDHFFKYC